MYFSLSSLPFALLGSVATICLSPPYDSPLWGYIDVASQWRHPSRRAVLNQQTVSFLQLPPSSLGKTDQLAELERNSIFNKIFKFNLFILECGTQIYLFYSSRSTSHLASWCCPADGKIHFPYTYGEVDEKGQYCLSGHQVPRREGCWCILLFIAKLKRHSDWNHQVYSNMKKDVLFGIKGRRTNWAGIQVL